MNYPEHDPTKNNEVYSSERLFEIAQNSWFVIGSRLVYNEQSTLYHIPKDLYESTGGGISQNQKGILNLMGLNANHPQPYNGEIVRDQAEDFAEADVAEVVTFLPATWYLKRSEGEAGGGRAMEYRTTGSDKFPFRDRHGRRGNYLRYAIVFTDSESEEAQLLYDATRDNPLIIRELIEQSVHCPNLAAQWTDLRRRWHGDVVEEWEMERPPYEEWRAINNGVSKMAFRKNPLITPRQYPEHCEIVEF